MATMPANSHSTPHYHRMLAAHGWIAVIGLGFLIPLGIVISKASSHTKLWTAGFWLHVPVQVCIAEDVGSIPAWVLGPVQRGV